MSTLPSLQYIRESIPAANSRIYLNAGTFGPIPTCVIDAMQERLQAELKNGRLGTEAFEQISTIYQDARSRVARLLNASSEEIALTDNTGEGLNIITHGIAWQAGDEVITTNHEHISALAPLYQIRDRLGVVIRIAELGPLADQPLLEAFQAQITPRTRLIVLSHVTWSTGTVLEIQSLTKLAREQKIPLLIDGAQSAGNIPINVQALGVDFYAIPMQKWLCGPDGTGALYVRQASLHYIAPTYVGYYSCKHEPGLEWELNDDARRFELGGRQTAAIAGQSAILHWLENTIGYQWLFERISMLNTYAYHALKTIPALTILSPQPGSNGILSFTIEGRDDVEIVKQLQADHNIYIRNIPSIKALRISTGFYNIEEEIDTLAQALSQL